MGSSFSTSSTFSTSSSSHGSISSSIGSPSQSRLNFNRYVYGSTTTPKKHYYRNYIFRSPNGDIYNNDYHRNETFGSHSTNNNASRKQIFLNGWNLTKRVAVNAFAQQFNYTSNFKFFF